MRFIKRIFVAMNIILSLFFCLLGVANGQSASVYLFLEVVDDQGVPVANAKAEAIGFGNHTIKNTDEKAKIKDFEIYLGDYQTEGIKVSKAGYATTIISFGSLSKYYSIQGEIKDAEKRSELVYCEKLINEQEMENFSYLLECEDPKTKGSRETPKMRNLGQGFPIIIVTESDDESREESRDKR